MEEQKPELLSFLLVNENNIRKSDQFTDYVKARNNFLNDCYDQMKTKHMRDLSFFFFLENLLDVELKIPDDFEKMQESYDELIKEHEKKIKQIAYKFDVSDELVISTSILYSIIMNENYSKSEKEEKIIGEIHEVIKQTDQTLNKELDELGEQYKRISEEYIFMKNRQEFAENIKLAIGSVKQIHKLYVDTFGFDETYIDPQYQCEITKLKELMELCFNLCQEDDEEDDEEDDFVVKIPIEKIAQEFCKMDIKKCISKVAMVDYAKNYRGSSDATVLFKFLKNGTIDQSTGEYKETHTRIFKTVQISFFLIVCHKILKDLKKACITLYMELDIDSEIQKIEEIKRKYFKEQSLNELKKKLKGEIRSANKERISANEEESFDDYLERLVFNEEDTTTITVSVAEESSLDDIIEAVKKIQFNKIKEITDEITNRSKMEKDGNNQFPKAIEKGRKGEIEEYERTPQEIWEKIIQLNKLVKGAYECKKDGEKDDVTTIEKMKDVEKNIKDFPQNRSGKNRFYLCNFDEKIGIMTFPNPNVQANVQGKKYSRAAILLDVEDLKYISQTSRGAYWPSDANDRVKIKSTKQQDKEKESSSIAKRIYTGRRISINNNRMQLIEDINKRKGKDDITPHTDLFLKSHKFDYRRENIGNVEKEKPEENRYYPIEEIPWITDDNMDISKYRAVRYISSAIDLEKYIEGIVNPEVNQEKS